MGQVTPRGLGFHTQLAVLLAGGRTLCPPWKGLLTLQTGVNELADYVRVCRTLLHGERRDCLIGSPRDVEFLEDVLLCLIVTCRHVGSLRREGHSVGIRECNPPSPL